jgi:hypothetical protein
MCATQANARRLKLLVHNFTTICSNSPSFDFNTMQRALTCSAVRVEWPTAVISATMSPLLACVFRSLVSTASSKGHHFDVARPPDPRCWCIIANESIAARHYNKEHSTRSDVCIKMPAGRGSHCNAMRNSTFAPAAARCHRQNPRYQSRSDSSLVANEHHRAPLPLLPRRRLQQHGISPCEHFAYFLEGAVHHCPLEHYDRIPAYCEAAAHASNKQTNLWIQAVKSETAI